MPDTPANILDAIPTLEPELPAEEFVTWELVIGGSLALLVLLAVLALVFFFISRAQRKRLNVPVVNPLDNALAALAELEEELPPLRPCALRLSLLLRAYLAGCAQDPALYETQEEFSQRMDSLAGVPAALRPELRELLDELAGYKYAAETQAEGSPCRALTERARNLLLRLDTARREEAARRKEEGGAA